MAKMEQYIFNVDANTSKAVDKLSEINKLMDQIDKVHARGTDDFFTTNQKDMDKNMRSMSKMSQLYQEASKDLDELYQKMEEISKAPMPTGRTEEHTRAIRKQKIQAAETAKEAIKQQQLLRSEYQKTLQKFQSLASFQQNASKNFKPVFMSNDLRNMPVGGSTPEEQRDNRARAKKTVNSMLNDKDPVTGRMDDVLSKIQEVNKLERRSESTSRRAAASNYMSFQQKSTFVDDLNKSKTDYTSERDKNVEAITDIGQERTKLTNRVKEIETNPNATTKEIDEKVAIQATIDSMDKEWEARSELNRVLERTIKNMERYNESLNGVEVKPERGTVRGMMYERAPAIGMALTGAVGGTLGNMYSQGKGINKGMRDDVISIGQRTDSEDWRYNIRDEAFSQGMNEKLGFSGQQMLDFQNNYMSNTGYEGMDDLKSAAENQGKFSRVSGVDADTTKQFFDSVYSTGAVNGTQTKDIQDAFIGGIKNSGMEGREKDQISALEGILGSISQGRTMTNEDVMNTMGLQSVLASSGSRSLSGESGGQLLQGMNEGIRSSFSDPMVRMVMGQGTEYQGLEGRFALRERMDEGISNSRNVTDIAKFAESQANSEDGQNEAFASFVQEKLGTDITAEQSRGLMGLYRDGQLTEDNIKGVMEADKAKGKEVSEDRLNEYQSSKEGTANQSEAVWEKQVANIEDFGDAVKAINSTLGKVPAVFYGAGVAVAALGAAAAFTASSFGVSSLLRGRTAGTYSAGGGRAERRRNAGGAGGSGGSGGVLGRVGGWFGMGGGANNAGGGTGGAGGGGTGGRVAGALGKVGGVLGKAALPLAVVGGVASVATAPEDQKGEAVGSAVGGIGGGMAAGALTGAAVGSVFPGVGTAIGGVVGGIGGAIGGSKLGGWIGGMFDGKSPEEKAAATAASTAGVVGAAGATAGLGATGTPSMNTGGMSGASNMSTAGLGTATSAAATVGTLGLATGGSSWLNGKPDAPANGDLDQQVERENTNRKGQAETQRTDNIAAERENMTRYESLLDKAQQILNQARSQNGIFGSGTATDGQSQSGAVLSGSDNAEKTWSFFQQQGFSAEATAGVMGNLMQESQLDPTAVNPTSGAFGIGQWLGGRKTNLENYAKEKGTDVTDLGTQLEFLMKELKGGDSTTKSILDKNGGIDALKGSKDVDWVTRIFESAFERSGGSAMGKRGDYADDFYKTYGRTAQWDSTGTKVNTAKATSGGGKIESTINVKVTGDESVADKVNNSKEMKSVATKIQSQVYDSLGFYSREMRVT